MSGYDLNMCIGIVDFFSDNLTWFQEFTDSSVSFHRSILVIDMPHWYTTCILVYRVICYDQVQVLNIDIDIHNGM